MVGVTNTGWLDSESEHVLRIQEACETWTFDVGARWHLAISMKQSVTMR